MLRFASFIFLIFAGTLILSCKSNKIDQTGKEPPRGPLATGNLGATPSGTTGSLYGQIISIPSNASTEVVALAEEMAEWLRKGTGKVFRVTRSGSSQGIVLNLENSGVASASGKFREASLESYYLKSQGNSALYITARTVPGLSHGVFQYLERLGYRWYFPGEKWTIIPSLTDIRIQADEVVKPAFQNRTFFGTGGHGRDKVLDPQNQSMNAWNDWMRHTSWGVEYDMPGHKGAVFNQNQKEILVAHPEYQPEINGKRVAWKASNKHCYSNNGLTALWAKDRIEEYESLLRRFPNKYPRASIGVDPTDGGSHCQCSACLKMGSVSNRVFHAANVVAKAAEKKYPNAKVCLYAYNEHAAVPDMPLHKNIAVSIIPYQFQTIAPPEVFIEDWSRKVSNMNLYDYWNYTDKRFDKPQLNFLTIQDKIRFWAEKKIAGITLETSYSIGANGLGLYLGSKLMWNPELDVDATLDEFYRFTFGKAAPTMKRMMERWATQYHHLQKYELGNAYADLSEAEKLEKSPEIVARINDFKAYVHYLVLYHELKDLPAGSPNLTQKADQLVQYVWKINPTYMIHSYRISDRVAKVMASKAPAVKNKYETYPKVKNPAAWTAIRPINTPEIQRNFSAKRADYPTQIPIETHRGKVKLPARPQAQTRSVPGQKAFSEFSMLKANTLKIFNDKPNNQVTIELMATTPNEINRPKVHNFISFQDPSGNIILRNSIALDSKWHSQTFTMKATGLYTLHFDVSALVVEVKFPTDIPAAFSSPPVLKKSPKQIYFFVPKNLEKVYFEVQLPMVKIELTSPNGIKHTISGEKNSLKVLDIPENERGKLWSYYSYWINYKILNIPSYFFLSEKYFLPEDLID